MSEVFGPDSVFAGDKVRDPPAARGQFERVAIRECCLRVLSLDVAFLVIYKYIRHQHVVGKEPESSYFWSSREPATLSKGTQHPILKLLRWPFWRAHWTLKHSDCDTVGCPFSFRISF